MEKIYSLWRTLVSERKIQKLEKIQSIFNSLSITEKVIFLLSALVLVCSTLSILAKTSAHFSNTIPQNGGSLVEGIVGTPRFINPLLAISDADRDVTSLVYSGLLRALPDGSFVPDLAENFSISPDGLTYSIKIRDNATFHDNTPITAEDVKFTIEKARDPNLKSPRRVNWEGVTIEKAEGKEIVLSLKQPYTPFISSLTLGIIPKHLWSSLESDQIPFSALNINPVGSGLYKVSKVIRSKDGIPNEIILEAYKKYATGRAHIDSFTFIFFTNEKNLISALEDESIESASNITPTSAVSIKDFKKIITSPLTRVFGIFFNQNENETLAHKEVRKALDLAIDKDYIVENILKGYAIKTNEPLPYENNLFDSRTKTTEGTSTKASDYLTKAKWKKNPSTNVFELKGKSGSTTLSLSLSTANIPELVDVAKKIESDWSSLGAHVDVQVFEPTDLNQGVIRPRKYDALLFGLVTGKNSDLYPFWHSSQRNDPGLNIAIYTNSKADKTLEKMRQSTSTQISKTYYEAFKKEINNDTPAIFLWTPSFIYTIPEKLQGVTLGEITTPSDRFNTVQDWYIETDTVWKIFIKDKQNIITEN